MPSAMLDRNEFNDVTSVEQVGRFSKYSVYFALNQVQHIKHKQTFSMLYGSRDWTPNMGPTIAGVRMEPTPKARAEFRPQPLNARPKVDVYELGENREEATLYWHKFRSRQLYFIGSFQDFFKDQVVPAADDLNDQITYNNDLFIRTFMWDRSPFVYFAGVGGPLMAAPNSGQTSPSITAAPTAAKSAAWVLDCLPMTDESLTLPVIQNASLALQIDQGAAAFKGGQNGYMQNKYCLICSSEAASQWIWDVAFQRLRNESKDYLNNNIEGDLFGNVMIKYEQHPMRFDTAGNLVPPEVWDPRNLVAGEDATLRGETVPNPNYASPLTAPWEVAWMLGADGYKTIKIGPPPAQFAGGASAREVNGMEWNGKVRMARNILIRNSDGTYDTNADGEFLQLRSTLTMGVIGGRPRNALPIVFRRKRVSQIT